MKKSTTEEFVFKARQHPNHKDKNYDYSKVNYLNNSTKVCIICPEHGEFWQSPAGHLQGQGCPVCGEMTRILAKTFLKEKIIEKLSGKNIKIVGEYKNTQIKTELECEICFYRWKTALNNILNGGNGCPHCAGNAKLTNEEVDARLKRDNRTVERDGDVKGVDNKSSWKCAVCLHRWKATPNSIFSRGSGCPRCVGKERLTNELVDARLKRDNISVKRIGNIKNNKSKIVWECETCLHRWEATPNNILNKENGCPRCKQSKGELKIENWLKENEFSYKSQYRFSDCRNKKPLPFDKAVFDKSNKLLHLIEFDGEDHFPPTEKNMKRYPKRYNQKNTNM